MRTPAGERLVGVLANHPRSHKEALALKLTLFLLPDGKGILSTEDQLSKAAAEELRYQYQKWAGSNAGLIVLSECRVQRVSELALELNVDGITVR